MYPDEPEDHDAAEAAPAPAKKAKPSLAPSWVMLGFIVGALFVWALPQRQPPAPPVERAAEPPRAAPPVPQLTTIEAVFAEWGRFAVWDNDLTEVALWRSETGSYSDCFEVLRTGSAYYFRSIPRLTRPVLTHGVRTESPLQFTETEAQRAEWLGEKRRETWRALSEAARSPAPVPPAESPPRQVPP